MAPFQNVQNVVFDGETADPDDMMTVLLLLAHAPAVALRAVVLYPGSRHQVGLVKKILSHCGCAHIPVGSARPDHPKSSVSGFHKKFIGDFQPSDCDGLGWEVLRDVIQKFPETTVISGGPPFNLAELIKNDKSVVVRHWVAQGGFAGSNVTQLYDDAVKLEKFRGKEFMPAANWGSVAAIKVLLGSDNIEQITVVSKNVCHSVQFDQNMLDVVNAVDCTKKGKRLLSAAFLLFRKAMQIYLARKTDGKLFHDPLAAAIALRPSIAHLVPVYMRHLKSTWGCVAAPSKEKAEGKNEGEHAMLKGVCMVPRKVYITVGVNPSDFLDWIVEAGTGTTFEGI